MSYTLIPTILCGGAGSSLWPVSREQLIGDTEQVNYLSGKGFV